ncbi:MAG TPA: SpoIIE family protein phosphatase [Verrucomicrobiae bacterium]|nr:SpoIIE family protein phosphatase [Verrucomicrobiae bacterium]
MAEVNIPGAGVMMDWSVATRPIAGQSVSGDLYLVKPFKNRILAAVIDGVGHGDEAAEAARQAMEIMDIHAAEPVISLVKRCHDALLRTRGVVLTVAKLDTVENTMTWLGVGNVEGRLWRADAGASHPRESVLLRGGLVGYQLPALQASVIPVAAGDLLILATDGIHPSFEDGVNRNETPRQIADEIMSRHFKGNDDALVLVVRYLGAPHE